MSERPLNILIVDEGGQLTDEALRHRFPGSSLQQDGFSVTTNPLVHADLVLVFNRLKYDRTLIGRRGFFWKADYEPLLNNQSANGFDRILSFRDYVGVECVTIPPILDWWLDKSYDELLEMRAPRKLKKMSAIASTKEMIEGHRLRNHFIERLESNFPEIDIFGRGRPNELSDKMEGVGEYEFSIAIENSSIDHYWTEKIADCLLAFSVPLYFGAPNISDYFPEGSVINLPLDDPDRALDLVGRVLTEKSWESRLPAISEARSRLLEKYSLFGRLREISKVERDAILAAPQERRLIKGRRVKRVGWDHRKSLPNNLARLIRRAFRRAMPRLR